jgi:hypothetical protein
MIHESNFAFDIVEEIKLQDNESKRSDSQVIRFGC